MQNVPYADTANHYHNQVGVARGIAESGVPASAFWLQTKVEPCGHSTITPVLEGHCYNGTVGAFQQNLQQLNVSQVDLTLLHAPPCVPNSSWADPMCYWPDQPDAIYPQHANCSAPEPCRMMRAQWKALEDMCVLDTTTTCEYTHTRTHTHLLSSRPHSGARITHGFASPCLFCVLP